LRERRGTHNGKYIEFPEGDRGTVINEGMPGIFEFFQGQHPLGRSARALNLAVVLAKALAPALLTPLARLTSTDRPFVLPVIILLAGWSVARRWRR